MSRIPTVPAKGANPIVRFAYRATKREVGRSVEPIEVYAHSPVLLAGYGMFEKATARQHRVEERLKLLAEGLIPNVPTLPRGSRAEREADEEEDNALFLATSCEEKPFPWQRAAPPATRRAEALAALHALPSSAFYPFDAATAHATGKSSRAEQIRSNGSCLNNTGVP